MINFAKGDGLIPVIIQDADTLEVRMLGYMNEEAWAKTQETKKVTFYSRSKERLWTKGEESGHFLEMVDYAIDCDQDTLLIKVHAQGPTCHTGQRNCFETPYNQNFLFELEQIVQDRIDHPVDSSYVHQLRSKGINKVAQKVGEEGVETVIAALAESEKDLINESSDLLFHLIVLLRSKGLSLATIAKNLEQRHS
jgi:phosphoribosyl-ATP pyrophosphohydrolase/phosphoribosyl-AMP cyclohydrolase